MRIAIISDIHSNLPALMRALSIIDEENIDQIYCLGDIVGYGGSPNECVELVRTRVSHCVLGNHDAAAVDITRAKFFSRPGRVAVEWTNTVLTPENAAYLKKLPYRLDLDPCTLSHANPSAPELWDYILTLQQAEEQFKAFATPFCFIGHTHVPVLLCEDMRTFTLKRDLRYLINVGSVGQPRDGNPHLSFGILDTEAWTYRNVRAEYDLRGAAEAILKNGLPGVLANRLFKGM
jgi:predicted phosphodiesterase